MIDPPLAAADAVLRANRRLIESWAIDIGGQPIYDLRRTARAELLEAAVQYVRPYRSVPWEQEIRQGSSIPLVLSGHQPELFHPGVWFKNFALSNIAELTGAIAVNLVVDNDLAGSAAVRCPTLDDGRIRRESVAFDGPVAQAIPFEQRWITDVEAFTSFPSRLTKTLSGLVDSPLVHALWAHASKAVRRCNNLGCSLAQARHGYEDELGLRTLEVPVSVVSRTPGFGRFVLSMLDDLERFRLCYNSSLLEYRRLHGIRSSAHPVPALGKDDHWLEAPLWIYGDHDPRRRAAWVRRSGNELEISDRVSRTIRLQVTDSDSTATKLAEIQSADFKLRPRALVTTMFARLILSDLFIHGIGGAKYDQLGDKIVERFFGIKPPEYYVISATVLLPGWKQLYDRFATERSVREIDRALRDIKFSPELFKDHVELPADLLLRKAQLLQDVPTGIDKQTWHEQLVSTNQKLTEQLESVEIELKRELAGAFERDRQLQLWHSREHSFAIFPIDYLIESFASHLYTF